MRKLLQPLLTHLTLKHPRLTTHLRLNHLKGEYYEAQALTFLQRQGLLLVDRNYRCRYGEIDLVMQEGDVLIFVEVRYRENQRHGGALESITKAKQERIWLTAHHYLQKLSVTPRCRIDVIAFEGHDDCQWIKDAIQR